MGGVKLQMLFFVDRCSLNTILYIIIYTFFLKQSRVYLLDGQRYCTANCATGFRVTDVAWPSPRARQVAENEFIRPSVRGQLQQRQHGRPKHDPFTTYSAAEKPAIWQISVLCH